MDTINCVCVLRVPSVGLVLQNFKKQETKFREWLIQFRVMGHITTWEEDYKGNNTSPSLQFLLANAWSASCYVLMNSYKFVRFRCCTNCQASVTWRRLRRLPHYYERIALIRRFVHMRWHRKQIADGSRTNQQWKRNTNYNCQNKKQLTFYQRNIQETVT
jgi:hypothetical protein